MGRPIISTLVLAALSIGCGSNPIEELQREWINEQHVVETRLVAVRAAHIESRQALTQRLRQRRPQDSTGDALRIVVAEHDSILTSIEAMFDRQSQERQSAIDAGDPARMRTALDSARRDYATATHRIDSLATAIAALKRRRGG